MSDEFKVHCSEVQASSTLISRNTQATSTSHISRTHSSLIRTHNQNLQAPPVKWPRASSQHSTECLPGAPIQSQSIPISTDSHEYLTTTPRSVWFPDRGSSIGLRWNLQSALSVNVRYYVCSSLLNMC